MSRALEYAAKCAECKRPMRPGTLVEFIKDGPNYTYIHALSCDDPIHDPAPVKPPRPHFEIRVCSKVQCYGAAGYGFEGKAPPVCHLCGSPWQEDLDAADPAAELIGPAQIRAATENIGRAA